MISFRYLVFFINILFFLFPFFLFFAQKVLAVTIVINNFPSSISSDPFNIDFSLDGPNPGTNYLRIDLYKEGTTNYFGETFNGVNWYGGSSGSQYFPVDIKSGSTASGTIQGKVGNPTLSEYPGPGAYKLRLRRYTGSGNPASRDQQTPVDLQVNVSSPTPTPTLTPTSTQTPTPTSISTSTPTPKPTSTPRPSPTPTKTVINQPTPIPSAEKILTTGASTTTAVLEEKSATDSGTVAGVLAEEEESATKSSSSTSKQSGRLPKILLGLAGLAIFAMVGSAFWIKRRKGL